MLSTFLKFGKDQKLFITENKVLLAVSGGLDSVAMAELFSKGDIPFSIAHCNFSLRGKESDADAEFVKNLAKGYGVKFHSKKFNTESYARKEKVSTQLAARDLRYQWFRELLKKENYQSLATAHHLDDSIETFFINLMRGTGIKGLSGIPVKTAEFIRPLSCFARKEILDFAKKENLKWREDSSNASDDYLRNRIRHKLIPVLHELLPEFNSVMEKNLENIRQSVALQAEITSALKKKYLKLTSKGSWILNLRSLMKEPESKIKLQLILSDLSIKATKLNSLFTSGDTGKLFYSGEFSLLKDRGNLHIKRLKNKDREAVSLNGSEEEFHYYDLNIHVKTDKFKAGQALSKDPNRQQLDAEKLSFPLKLRQWEAGDYFYPLGMRGRKKLSDFLVDNKVNRFDKENCLVLLSGKDIVCILGHRIDDRYKITDQTKSIFTIKINEK